MRHSLTGLLAAIAMGGLMAAGATPAAAQVASPGSAVAVTQDSGLTTMVQSRRGWRGRGYSNRRAYNRRGYRRGYGYRRGGSGAAIGAGIAGLAAGAIIGGALSSQAAPVYAAPGGSAVEYCLSRFRSYDPASGTYLGYDGLRHPCP